MARGLDDIAPTNVRENKNYSDSGKRGNSVQFSNDGDFRSYFQQWNPNKTSFVSNIFYDALSAKFTTRHGRGVEFRPSSFPQCPIINYLKKIWYDNAGYNIAERSCSMDYYCDVGTVVHETVQFHMGDSGAQFGHYRCINPNCKHGKAGMPVRDAAGNIIKAGKLTRKNTFNNKCPKCKERMFYEELTVKYKGIKGHVDGVIRRPDGTYWIIDYKTSSMKKILKGEYPEKKHLYQLPVYAYILKKKYGFDVAGFSLIYIPRDNPFCFYEYAERWGTKWDKHSRAIIKTQKKQWSALEKTLETKDLSHIIAAKPCTCESTYLKRMYSGFDHCPMREICFSARLKSALESWTELAKSKSIPDATLAEAVKVITEKQRKTLFDSKKGKGAKSMIGIARKPLGKVRVL